MEDVPGKPVISTGLHHNVTIQGENVTGELRELGVVRSSDGDGAAAVGPVAGGEVLDDGF